MPSFQICLVILCFTCRLFAGQNLTFEELNCAHQHGLVKETYEGKQLNVKGFLYQKADGEWILASQPNLRSCCVGASQHVGRQLLVEGEFNPDDKVVEIEGSFHMQLLADNTPSYRLLHASIAKSNQGDWPFTTILFTCLFILAFFTSWLFYRNRA